MVLVSLFFRLPFFHVRQCYSFQSKTSGNIQILEIFHYFTPAEISSSVVKNFHENVPFCWEIFPPLVNIYDTKYKPSNTHYIYSSLWVFLSDCPLSRAASSLKKKIYTHLEKLSRYPRFYTSFSEPLHTLSYTHKKMIILHKR